MARMKQSIAKLIGLLVGTASGISADAAVWMNLSKYSETKASPAPDLENGNETVIKKLKEENLLNSKKTEHAPMCDG